MSRRDTLMIGLVALVWGFNFVVIDWGMHGVPPLLFVAIRFCVVIVPAVFLVPRPSAPVRRWLPVGIFTSLGQFGFLYAAIAAGMPAGLAALVLQAHVIFTIVLAAGVLREVPTAAQVVGVTIGSVGLVVVGLGRGGGTPLPAVLLAVAAALSWGIGNVVTRSSGVTGGLSLTVWSALVVPVPAAALSLAIDGPAAVSAGLSAFGWPALASTLYTAGVASLVGYGTFNTLLGRNPPSAVVPWILLVPPIAMVSAWLCLGEVPHHAEAVGAAVMLLGVLVALRPRSARQVRTAPAPADLGSGAVTVSEASTSG